MRMPFTIHYLLTLLHQVASRFNAKQVVSQLGAFHAQKCVKHSMFLPFLLFFHSLHTHMVRDFYIFYIFGRKMAQDGTKMASRRSKLGPRWPKMARRWRQDGPKMGPSRPKMAYGYKMTT